MKLIELIEKHERQWGTEHYAGRPKLAEVLEAPVVAFGCWPIPKKSAKWCHYTPIYAM